MKKILAAGAIATALLTAPASAQMLDSITADQLESVLSEAGLSPEMIPNANGGFPVAYGDAGDNRNFYVRGLSCSGRPLACQELVFFAEFELGRDVAASDYRIVNRYNDSQVFGRAFVLPKTGKVGVDYVIELGGGVSEEHITQNISRWADVISAFLTKFEEGEPTS